MVGLSLKTEFLSEESGCGEDVSSPWETRHSAVCASPGMPWTQSPTAPSTLHRVGQVVITVPLVGINTQPEQAIPQGTRWDQCQEQVAQDAPATLGLSFSPVLQPPSSAWDLTELDTGHVWCPGARPWAKQF